MPWVVFPVATRANVATIHRDNSSSEEVHATLHLFIATLHRFIATLKQYVATLYRINATMHLYDATLHPSIATKYPCIATIILCSVAMNRSIVTKHRYFASFTRFVATLYGNDGLKERYPATSDAFILEKYRHNVASAGLPATLHRKKERSQWRQRCLKESAAPPDPYPRPQIDCQIAHKVFEPL